MLGVIDAEQGKNVRASLTWRELIREAPDYEPAHKHLALLGGQSGAALGETAAVDRPPAAAVKATEAERDGQLPASGKQPRPAQSIR
jgi:hypothetical protein